MITNRCSSHCSSVADLVADLWSTAGVIGEVQPHLISLVATGTWLSCSADTESQATAIVAAANQWLATNPQPLSDCPFDGHIPKSGFSLSFVVAQVNDQWGCYCDCSWLLEYPFDSVEEAIQAADKYCDALGVSPQLLESIVFERSLSAEQPQVPHQFYIFDPELSVYDSDGQHLNIYQLKGAAGALIPEKFDDTYSDDNGSYQ